MIYFAVFSFDSSIDGYLFRSLNPVLYDVNPILNHVKVKPFFIPIFLLCLEDQDHDFPVDRLVLLLLADLSGQRLQHRVAFGSDDLANPGRG